MDGDWILGEALDDGKGRASPASESRMRAVLPRRSRAPLWAAAAAVLLAAAWRVGSPRTEGRPVQAPVRTRLLSLPGGAEAILAEGAVLRDGVLEKGACLLSACGSEVRITAGSLDVRVSDGEVLVRRMEGRRTASLVREARASEGDAEAWVLSGRAEVNRVPIQAGQGVSGGKVLPAPPGVRDSVFAPAPKASRRLDRSGWTEPAPGGEYQASVRLRLSERPATVGFAYEVDGRPTLWVPEEAALSLGAWHTLRAVVSGSWITLSVDGAVSHRVSRKGFRPNPAAGVSGVGPVVWGGKADAEGLDVSPLR